MPDAAPASRPQAVFDLDGTLLHGDSGALLMRHLLKRNRWREWAALSVAPIGFALMAVPRLRRHGVSIFLWIATVGHGEEEVIALTDAFHRTHTVRRIEPAIAALQAALDAGDDVTVATGAFQPLAERLVAGLGLHGMPRVVGSTTRPFAGGHVARLQANGSDKLRRLAECGVHPPFARAWSDSRSDLPLLAAAAEAHWVTRHAAAPREVRARLPGVIVHRVAID